LYSSGIMSDEELSGLNIKELNRKLKEKNLPKALVEKLKQRRRTLKNRKYATDCRENKDIQKQTLEETLAEETSMESLEIENELLRAQIAEMKAKFERMEEFARNNRLRANKRRKQA